jgi:hypothetical protein
MKPIKIAGIRHHPRHAWQNWYRREVQDHARRLAAPHSRYLKGALFPANGVKAEFIGGDMAGGNLAEVCRYVAELLPVACAGEYHVKIRRPEGAPAHFVFGQPDYEERRIELYGTVHGVRLPRRNTFNELFSVPIPAYVWGEPCRLLAQNDDGSPALEAA